MKKLFLPGVVLGWALCLSCSDENEKTTLSQDIVTEQAFFGQTGTPTKVAIGGVEINASMINGQYVFEGDILIDETDIDAFTGKKQSVGLTGNRWPNGVVYYAISSNLSNQARVTNAIAHWESKTAIRFVKRTTEPNYIFFQSGSGCSSSLGMRGGKQVINLASGCSTGNAIHEIGHALGLFHEHTRTDRDNTITVNWGNVSAGTENNFERADLRYSAKDYSPTIDFGSIMMYPSNAFSSNGRPTLVRKDGSTWQAQRSSLSAADIQGIDAMY